MPSAGSVPLRWHIGQPNFGDDLNPYFFAKLLSEPVRFTNQARRHLLGIGSILNTVNAGSIVVGSGLLSPEMIPKLSAMRIVSLRGFRTAESIGCDPGHYGDPALLVARLFPQSIEPTYRLGLIPHHSQVKQWKSLVKSGSNGKFSHSCGMGSENQNPKEIAEGRSGQDVLYIDPSWHPLRVIDSIRRCRGILSQSLHGLIIADAYGIPNGWLSPAPQMKGGDFKFADYYSTTKDPKHSMQSDSIKKYLDAKDLPLFVSPYRFNLADYHSYLVREIKRELAIENVQVPSPHN
jgi:pyruvyltransferase